MGRIVKNVHSELRRRMLTASVKAVRLSFLFLLYRANFLLAMTFPLTQVETPQQVLEKTLTYGNLQKLLY